MKNQEITIYVVQHKKTKRIREKGYVYIGVGKNSHEIESDITDDTGDNIASKNPSYCELTAQYWIFKNANAEFVGLAHYRRFFYHSRYSFFKIHPYTADQFLKILQKYDVVLPKKYVVKRPILNRNGHYHNVYEHWCANHHEADLKKTINVIHLLYPDYDDAFATVLKRKSLSLCNMVVTSKKIYDEYSNFLFHILERVESETDLSSYDSYNARLYGFLSEVLMNVFFEKNKQYHIKYLDICNTETSTTKQYFIKIAASIRRMFNK